ncbi:MAG: hypothetical protein SF052_24305 [Bacteroidia bacterium]|nr:hypothetical protein [Bacteroidia bacterium]
MIRICIVGLILFGCTLNFLSAQKETVQQSFFGGVHTPKGDLHLLVVFVRYENICLFPDSPVWPDSTAEGVLPKIAKGDPNDLFHADPEAIRGLERVQNISDYFYVMSGGQFRITADIFPAQVPITYVSESKGNFFGRQAQMNTAAVKWITQNYPNFDWGRYDRRTNRPNFSSDNSLSSPDSIIDYIIFMHRAQGSTGMGASSSIDIPGSPFKIRDGHTGIKSYTDNKHNWEYFKHEFAHNLYNCPHYLGANSADGDKFYTQKGWGLMAAWHSSFFTANAWESWWLGWLEPQEISRDGVYKLGDFVTGREAIRIQLPGTLDYLWIENHQKRDLWDEKLFFKDPAQGHPQSAPGLYMYVVASPGADRNKPQLNPFSNKHANMIKMLNAEGNFDYVATGDSMFTGYFLCPLVEKRTINPIAGQNPFQFIRADYNRNGEILVGLSHGNSDTGGREQMDIWTEVINGENVYTLSSTGDENDAFEVGDETGLSGIFPTLNYPVFDKKENQLGPYILNGITIKILSVDTEGNYSLDIRLNDWEVRNQQRWCGSILFPGQNANNDNLWLTLQPGAELTLDLSGTPDRTIPHAETGTFSNPTKLTVEANRGIKIASGAALIVNGFSELHLHANAQIEIEKGGKMIVREKGTIVLNDLSQIIVRKKGLLVVESGGHIRQMRDAKVAVERGGKWKDL